MPQRKSKPKKRKVKIGDKEYPEITPDEQKEIIAQMDMDEKQKKALDYQLYQRITNRMETLLPIRDEFGAIVAYIKRLNDGEFNDVLGRHVDKMALDGKSFEKMSASERQAAEDFMDDLIASSVFAPEQLKDPKVVRQLDKALRLKFQTEVSALNGLGVSQKNFDVLPAQS